MSARRLRRLVSTLRPSRPQLVSISACQPIFAPNRWDGRGQSKEWRPSLLGGRCRRRIWFMDEVQRSEEWIVPRGREIYERRVRPGLQQEDEGAFVVIDVESGDYEVAADEEEAFARLEARRQGDVFFFCRDE